MTGNRVAVYVDGFNLYYRALQKRPACKWLDLHALCTRMLHKKDHLVSIKYFTARILPRPDDPSQTQRQDFLLRALATIPNLTIFEGRFTQNPKRMFLAPGETLFDAAGCQVKFATVVKSDEKGSDVNLAAHLLVDGFENTYDLAVLISADTDLAQPLRLARVVLKKKVALFSPTAYLHQDLTQYASFKRVISEADLLASQFPDQITDATGTFHRPTAWR